MMTKQLFCPTKIFFGMLILLNFLSTTLQVAGQEVPLPPNLAVITPENADQLVEVARIGNGQVMNVAWSPDEQQLAVASTVGVWMVEGFSVPPRLLEGLSGIAQDVIFSPDGLLLASGDGEGTIFLWHGKSGQLLKRIETDLEAIVQVSFNADLTQIVIGDYRHFFTVLNLMTNEVVYEYEPDNSNPPFSAVADIIFSPNGQYILSNVVHYSDVEWDTASWMLVDLNTKMQVPYQSWYIDQYKNSGNLPYNNSLMFTPDNNLVLQVVIEHGQMAVYHDFWTGEIVGRPFQPIVPSQNREPNQISNSFRGTFCDENAICIYSHTVTRNYPLASLPYWSSNVKQFITAPARFPNGNIIPDQYHLLVVYSDLVELWNVSTSAITLQWEKAITRTITAVMFVDTGRGIRLVVGNDSGEFWFLRGDEFKIVKPNGYPITSIVFISEDDVTFTFAHTSRGGLQLSTYRDGQMTNEILIETQADLMALEYLSQYNVLVYQESRYCQENCNQLFAYDLTTHQNGIWLNLEGQYDGGWVLTHDLSKIATVNQPLSHLGYLSVGSDILKLWNLDNIQIIDTIWENTDETEYYSTPAIFSLAFSPDDRLLAGTFGNCLGKGCGYWEQDYNVIRLWDVETQQELVTLRGHTERVMNVAFALDGKLLITGSWDGTVRFWGVPEEN